MTERLLSVKLLLIWCYQRVKDRHPRLPGTLVVKVKCIRLATARENKPWGNMGYLQRRELERRTLGILEAEVSNRMVWAEIGPNLSAKE